MRSNKPSKDPKEIALLTKLNTALKYARTTLVLSNNKYEDYTKSNGWSALTPHLSFKQYGGYIKHVVRNPDGTETKTPFTSGRNIDLSAEVTFNINGAQATMPDNHWFFDSALYYYNISIRNSRIPFEAYDIRYKTLKDPDDKSSPMIEVNPLQEGRFNLSDDLKNLLLENIATSIIRSGNCYTHSSCILHYLWQHSDGIHRIEIMLAPGFDHTFVIVNRSGSPTDPDTWGDAWIIDGWYKNGIIYHAIDYKTKIEEIKNYCLENTKMLFDATGIPGEDNPMLKGYSVNPVIIEVKPSENIYPVEDNFKAISDYYELNDFRYMPHGRSFMEIKAIKTQHQEKMKSTLTDLGVFKQDDHNLKPENIPNEMKCHFKKPRK